MRYIYIPVHSQWPNLPAFIFLCQSTLCTTLLIRYERCVEAEFTVQVRKMFIVKPLTAIDFISLFSLDILLIVSLPLYANKAY